MDPPQMPACGGGRRALAGGLAQWVGQQVHRTGNWTILYRVELRATEVAGVPSQLAGPTRDGGRAYWISER